MGFLAKTLLAMLLVSLGFNAYLFYEQQRIEAQLVAVILGEPVVMRTPGGVLEVSTINVVERYEQASMVTVLGMQVPSTETVAIIQAPVTYRYHVQLAPEWRFFRRDNVFVVIAPPIKPSLPVAFDTTGLQVFSRGVWSPITGRAAIDSLMRLLTPLLNGRAGSSTNIELQRDAARKTVAEYVKKWVAGQDRWKSLPGIQIQVFFADEPPEKVQAAGFALAPYKL